MSDSHKHNVLIPEVGLRVKALESLLAEKGVIDSAALDLIVETFQKQLEPENGAKVVAKAWVDAEYKKWLLKDGTAAIKHLGFSGVQGENMVVVENTPKVHNVVVCTLCSYYPWPTLGLPPIWFKSAPYRSRVVVEPRSVLEEFGVTIDDDVEVRTWDSSAELRYLVLPMRPAKSEGLSEAQLAKLATRNSMIGTGLALNP